MKKIGLSKADVELLQVQSNYGEVRSLLVECDRETEKYTAGVWNSRTTRTGDTVPSPVNLTSARYLRDRLNAAFKQTLRLGRAYTLEVGTVQVDLNLNFVGSVEEANRVHYTIHRYLRAMQSKASPEGVYFGFAIRTSEAQNPFSSEGDFVDAVKGPTSNTRLRKDDAFRWGLKLQVFCMEHSPVRANRERRVSGREFLKTLGNRHAGDARSLNAITSQSPPGSTSKEVEVGLVSFGAGLRMLPLSAAHGGRSGLSNNDLLKSLIICPDQEVREVDALNGHIDKALEMAGPQAMWGSALVFSDYLVNGLHTLERILPYEHISVFTPSF